MKGRSAHRSAVAALAVLLLFGGCGGDDGDDEGGAAEGQRTETQGAQTGGQGEPVGERGGREAAKAFIACLDEAGYKAVSLRLRQDPSAFLADSKGYEVASVLVNPDKPLEGAYARFFASEPKRKEATREPDLKFGTADVPATEDRGSAVVAYITKDARKALKSPIDRCLG
jgi:hypothetical protein